MQKCTKVVDIVMILDESGSVGRNDFQKIKSFVGDVISRFSVAPFGAHFAVVKYSSQPREVFSLTKYTNAAQLHTAVQNINYLGGGTYTGRAFELVQQKVINYFFTYCNSRHTHPQARIQCVPKKGYTLSSQALAPHCSNLTALNP